MSVEIKGGLFIMRKSITIFLMTAVFSVSMVVYGCIFVSSMIDETTLTEKTLEGNSEVVEGLKISFRADSGSDLHWLNDYEYGSKKTESKFKRGDLPVKSEQTIYENIRFTGHSIVPYVTRLEYDRLGGLQEKKIHDFYDDLQDEVMESGKATEGIIKTGEYIDYYPISFRFRFGTRTYNSSAALTGLKIYDEKNLLSEENAASYDKDVDMYVNFNENFKIPIIENEYQRFRITKLNEYDESVSLGYKSKISKPLGDGKDFYEFDPIIVVQEENLVDGMNWEHPDFANKSVENSDYESSKAKSASEYGLKNRLLFIINNRTAMGDNVDMSQISKGYGVYELPVDTEATATVGKSKRSWTLPDPKPLMEELDMVYSLDDEAEYVELSLSEDHRYLAVFSVLDGMYFAEIIDADLWQSFGQFELFPETKNLTYSWGEDGSLAITNHNDYIAVLYRDSDKGDKYSMLYSGRIGNGFDGMFFDEKKSARENSYSKYKVGIERGLAVTVQDGKAAFVQNTKVGNGRYSVRNATMECAVLDETGVIYRGFLKNDIVDIDYDMTAKEVQKLIDSNGGSRTELMKKMIRPIRNENSAEWVQ